MATSVFAPYVTIDPGLEILHSPAVQDAHSKGYTVIIRDHRLQSWAGEIVDPGFTVGVKTWDGRVPLGAYMAFDHIPSKEQVAGAVDVLTAWIEFAPDEARKLERIPTVV